MSGLQKYTPKQVFSNQAIQKRFEKVLGEKSRGFVTSVLQVINDSHLLSEADPDSVFNAAMTAATLDLPVNPNLGFAYIIPYKIKNRGVIASLQVGYKGLIQLCQRSGQFKTISATPVYEGQITKENPLTGFEFNFDNKSSKKVVGYAAYFALINGFEKTLYMSNEDVEGHAQTYSQSYRSNSGPWKDNFEAMALKTVLKLLLSKYAPMTVDMQVAVTVDQGEIKDMDGMQVAYIDNPKGGPPQQAESGRKAIDTQKQEYPATEEESFEAADVVPDEELAKGTPFESA